MNYRQIPGYNNLRIGNNCSFLNVVSSDLKSSDIFFLTVKNHDAHSTALSWFT